MPEKPSEELAREQAFLAKARADLALMRERVQSLEAVGGDPISDGYLAATLEARAAALVDRPDTPLFFGRTDTEERPWHIGRRHVQDQAGDPTVVDWRADIALAFYRATRRSPMGVSLRRRYGYDGGTLTAYEDEHLTDPNEQDSTSAILAAEIQRPRSGPMRDIVATIQPEQDSVVRADLGETVCVQGAPGTGKTAVGLHRVAYLLYAHRERLGRSGVLVVGPNRSFLSYIGQVLPALGELDVAQTTVDALAGGPAVRRLDPDAVARIKGDVRMAEVLRRAVWSHQVRPTEPLVVLLGSRRRRISPARASAAVDGLRSRDVRYGAGRTLLAQRLAHEVLIEMEREGAVTDDRDQQQIARHRAVRDYVDSVWPPVDPVKLVLRLLGVPGELGPHAEGILTDDEVAAITWERPGRGPASAPWSVADLVLVDEVRDLIDRTPSLGHVVLDEAQDLSPMQLRAVGRRCSTGSATVLGDLAQGTSPAAATGWEEALSHLGKPGAHIEELSRGFRVPADIINFAARLLPYLGVDLTPPSSVREDRGRLEIVPTDHLDQALVAACRSALRQPGSVGVIAADAVVATLVTTLGQAGLEHAILSEDPNDGGLGRAALTIVPAALAKGLEFDWVVVVEPADIVDAEPRGLNRLYVVLTRAVSGLTVVHARPLPDPLT